MTLAERRSRWLLVAVLALQLVLLSAQAQTDAGSSRLEVVFVRAVAPFSRLVSGTTGFLSSMSDGMRLRSTLERENLELRQEVERLRQERVRALGMEQELERLSVALDYVAVPPGGLRVADIVYVDHASWLQTLLLFVGEAKVERNQAVVSADGLVGRVVVAPSPYAKVQLVTDRAASVGGMVERTRRQGVVKGSSSGSLDFAFVPLQADVRAGDLVVTAGIDGIYPRGVPIGTVVEINPGDELFHEIRLAPTVDFGVLDQVYILDRVPVPEEVKTIEPDEGS
jgi:rod shape-determining protein MreC